MKISIAGCGNMGLIYARAFLKYNIVSKENLLLLEKNEARRDELQKLNIGNVAVTNNEKIKESDILIIAVKPQDFEQLSKDLNNSVGKNTVVISIMAGITLKSLSEKLKNHILVRAMPNSPAELGMGMTGFTCMKSLTVEQIRKAENLLSTTGRTIFFEDENLLDAVTALSGSGPAYFFYILKHMVEAGEKMGFDDAVSNILAKQTMLGAFHLANNANKSLDELIKTVSSKGGTTEAAFAIFNDKQVGENFQEGIMRAKDRAKELSV